MWWGRGEGHGGNNSLDCVIKLMTCKIGRLTDALDNINTNRVIIIIIIIYICITYM